MTAMLIWEYLITVDQEISLVWRKKHKVSMPSILLVTIRICMLSTAVGFGIAYLPGLSCTELKLVNLFTLVVYVVAIIQTAVFSALRVSALYGRNIWLFLIVLVFGLVPVSTNMYSMAKMTTITPEGHQCYATLDIPPYQERI